MGLEPKRKTPASIRMRLLAALLCVFVTAVLLAGCLGQQEITYQNKIRELSKRSNEISRSFTETMKAFEAQAQALFATQPASAQDALGQINQLLDMFSPKFQQFMVDVQQIQADLNNLQVPPRYSTAHSIYVSGMSSFVVSVQQVFNGFDMLRNFNTMQEAMPTLETATTFIKQGIDNLDKGDKMVFSTNWGLIVGVIIGVFAVVAGIVAFFVYLSRRRRYQPGYLAPGPVGEFPGPGYPPPPSGYPPPPVAYRSPSEAYPPPPGDTYPAPAPQGYPPSPQPGYPPPPVTGFPPPGTQPTSPPKQPVTCPRCGAEVTVAGAFCPSCNALLPGI